ncbi:porin, OprB family [Methylobacterium sp. ap11]|uniref:carbohydrate porin n=1 Tax=Methylobacterium sp. ap11 TaxID=1761799 RepID=UPI0008BFB6CD|nr:carbohydrate porin [Methylobacterium sp. ap11]SEP24099.1 porin, OprB family [Methylobacterium sp. ap11]
MREWRAAAVLAGLGLAAGGAAAQQAAPAPVPTLPILARFPLTGAGGDPQTAIAQARTSDQVSLTIGGSIQSSLGPYGDPFGARAFLAERGITYTITYIGEGLANLRGGLKRGVTYGGRLDTSLDVDLDKLAGWTGAKFHTDFFQIHGHGMSRSYVDNLTTVSGIEALPATRLFELWLEQSLFGDTLSVKVGQVSADTEFAIAQSAVVFFNAGFGWPNIGAVVLPSGGPIYPLATPAVRVKYVPDERLSIQAAIFDGDPAGRRRGDDTDPQRLNRTGTNFRTNDPPLLIGEVAYAYTLDLWGESLHGTATLGGWQHFGSFDSPRLDSVSGRLLADPEASGVARRFRGDRGVYGIIDQTLYREPGTEDQGASAFLRMSKVPGDRNLIDLYVDGGLAYKGLLPGRPNDTVALGVIYSRIGPAARAFDRDTILFGQGTGPIRSSEVVIEATYQAEVLPGYTLQPDLQFVMRPGGGLADDAGRRLKNATVMGLRATINY